MIHSIIALFSGKSYYFAKKLIRKEKNEKVLEKMDAGCYNEKNDAGGCCDVSV